MARRDPDQKWEDKRFTRHGRPEGSYLYPVTCGGCSEVGYATEEQFHSIGSKCHMCGNSDSIVQKFTCNKTPGCRGQVKGVKKKKQLQCSTCKKTYNYSDAP